MSSALGGVCRETDAPELALPYLTTALQFIANAFQCGLKVCFVDALSAQLLAQAGIAEARRAGVHSGFGVTSVRKKSLALQGIKQGLKLLGRFGVRRQFSRQFGTSVLAARQQLKGA